MANNKHHSFYREQQKSILGQQQWTPKRIGKLIMTILKWCLWGFLIIATLWGCVNEFIIQTSNNLGQGVEFYQKDDFVYPNTYWGANATGYTSSKEAVQVGSIVHEEDHEMEQTTPFNIYMMNPGLLDSEVQVAGFDDKQVYVSAIDYAEAGGVVPTGYYNMSIFSFLAIGGTGFKTEDRIFTDATGTDSKWVNSFKWTTELSKEFSKDQDGNQGSAYNGQYNISNTTDYAFYLLDKHDGKIDNKVDSTTTIAENINWTSTEDFVAAEATVDDAISINGSLMLNDPATATFDTIKTANIADWKVIDRLSTSDGIKYNKDGTIDKESIDETKITEAWNDQIISETNTLAFNNGTGVQSATDYLNITTTDGKTIRDLYNEEYKSITGTDLDFAIAEPYTADISTSLLTTGYTVYGGAQTIVMPITKGFPVRINEESQALIKNWRIDNFNDWDTSETKHDEGFDIENQMYGWTLLDYNTSDEENKASIMRVYDTADDAINDESTLTEANAFFADQRRIDWGLISTEDAGSINDQYNFVNQEDGQDVSVFDEKIKAWMGDDKYVRMKGTSTINGKSITFDYASEFAGMTSIEQYAYGTSTSSRNPQPASNYAGVLPRVVEGTQDGQPANVERSIFSDSIISSRQDSWGESRITFIGLSDWGKAWDVQYGPLYGAFVFPLAQLAMFIGEIFGYMVTPWGVIFSIITIVFLTRGLGALLSLKGTSNQMKMQEVQTDVAKIKAKYSKYDLKAEPRMKQKQQMEIMALYRKKEINPMGSLGTIFITMPIFISLWIIISALPAYKVVFMGNFSFAVSAWYGIFNLGWLFILYLLVGISVGLVQGISSKLPTWLSNKRKGIKRIDEATKEAQKKQNKTQNIMIGVFVFMGLTVPALFAFYWICSGFFTIILELIKHAWKVHVAEQMKKDQNYITPMARFKNKFKKA